MNICNSFEELRRWRRSQRARIGVFPTMGALHEGHLTQLRRLRYHCGQLVLSVFVNPTQFGPKEDFQSYPRDLDRDYALAKASGVDLVFAPREEEVYPDGYSTFVTETVLSQPLCGKFREGHFRGVTTVVLKLLELVRPNVALFGLKDAQQFFVIEKMCRDLGFETEIKGAPTLREPDGLAQSSRNAYLSDEARTKAPELYGSLTRAADALLGGEGFKSVLEREKAHLHSTGFDLQYFDLREFSRFEPLRALESKGSALLAAAGFLDGTRLIDNQILRPGWLRERGLLLDAPGEVDRL